MQNRVFRSLLFTIFVLLGVLGMTLGQPGRVYADPVTSVGVVDYVYLINHDPETPAVNDALRAAQDQAKKDFTDKSASLDDKAKQDLARQMDQQLAQKRQELLKPIVEKINAAIKEVADTQGLSIVIGKNEVVYGGVDITQDVLKIITGQ